MSWKNFKQCYVYTYLDDKHNPYYVGMGKGRRVYTADATVTVPSDRENNIVVIDDLSEVEAWNLEIKLIAWYGRKCIGDGILENLAPGGKTQKSGWHHSDQSKRNISKGNKGKIRTEAHKENYRGTKTKEHAENIRKGMIGKIYTEERKKNISNTKSKQRWYTDGSTCTMCVPSTEPNGFVPGRITNKETI